MDATQQAQDSAGSWVFPFSFGLIWAACGFRGFPVYFAYFRVGFEVLGGNFLYSCDLGAVRSCGVVVKLPDFLVFWSNLAQSCKIIRSSCRIVIFLC